MPNLLSDDIRLALAGGPYRPPAVRVGDHLFDEVRGDVVVGGYTSAPIPWPRVRKTGTPSLILCGDLVRAVRTESVPAIMYWWGVSETTVWEWRKALGVKGAEVEGTKRLYRKYKPVKLTDERCERGRQNASLPESIQKMASSLSGRPMLEVTRQALLKAISSPKSEDWKKKNAERMKEQWADGTRNRTPVWTKERLDEVLALREQGATLGQIMSTLGLTRDKALYALQKIKKQSK